MKNVIERLTPVMDTQTVGDVMPTEWKGNQPELVPTRITYQPLGAARQGL